MAQGKQRKGAEETQKQYQPSTLKVNAGWKGECEGCAGTTAGQEMHGWTWGVRGSYLQSHPHSPWVAQLVGHRSGGCPAAAAALAPACVAAPPPACSWPRSAAACAESHLWGRAAHHRPGREEAQEKDILAARAWDQMLVSGGRVALNGWASLQSLQNVCQRGQSRLRLSHLLLQTTGY